MNTEPKKELWLELCTYDLWGNPEDGVEVNDVHRTGQYVKAKNLTPMRLINFIKKYYDIKIWVRNYCGEGNRKEKNWEIDDFPIKKMKEPILLSEEIEEYTTHEKVKERVFYINLNGVPFCEFRSIAKPKPVSKKA